MSDRRSTSRPRGRRERGSPSRHTRRQGGDERSYRRAASPGSAIDLTDAGRGESARPRRVRPRRTSRRSRIQSDVALRPEVSGALAALIVALGSLLIVLSIAAMGWVLAADHSSFATMVDVAIVAWLAAHLVPIGTAGGWLWVPPLLLTGALVWGAYRVGGASMRRWTAPGHGVGWRTVAAAAGAYATTATVLAALASSAEARVPVWLVPFASALVFSIGFALAVESATITWRSALQRIPAQLRVEARAARRGMTVLLGAGAVAVLVALVASWGQVAEVSAALRPGISGTFVLFLATLIYLPTAAVWAMAFLVGPGFAIGQVGHHSPFSVAPAELPSFPLFAAAPDASSPWHLVVLIIPVVAGLVTAVSIPRGAHARTPGAHLRSRLRAGGLAAALAGGAGVLAQVSLGGRLTDMGPQPLLLAVAVFGWFALVALAALGFEMFGIDRRISRRLLKVRAVLAARAGRRARGNRTRQDPAGVDASTPSEHESDSAH